VPYSQLGPVGGIGDSLVLDPTSTTALILTQEFSGMIIGDTYTVSVDYLYGPGSPVGQPMMALLFDPLTGLSCTSARIPTGSTSGWQSYSTSFTAFTTAATFVLDDFSDFMLLLNVEILHTPGLTAINNCFNDYPVVAMAILSQAPILATCLHGLRVGSL
jgi:hypothetical protein